MMNNCCSVPYCIFNLLHVNKDRCVRYAAVEAARAGDD